MPTPNARAHLPTMNRTQARRLSRLKHRKQVERIGEKAASVALPFFGQADGAGFFRDTLNIRPAMPSLEFMQKFSQGIVKGVAERRGSK